MTRSFQFSCAIVFGAITACVYGLAAENAKIEQATDKSVTVGADTYTAKIDAQGHAEVSVKGSAALEGIFASGAAPTINVTGNLVAVRAGNARIEYTFGPDNIKVEQEGYDLKFRWGEAVKVALVPGGKGGPVGEIYYGNTNALIMANELTVSYSIPFHVCPRKDVNGERMLIPSYYASGAKKAGDLLQFVIKLGDPAEAAQFLSGITVEGIGSNWSNLNQDGNRGNGMINFLTGDNIALASSQQNTGKNPFELEYRLEVRNHYDILQVTAKVVSEQKQQATLESGKPVKLEWKLPQLPPGFYYGKISAWQQDKQLTNTPFIFSVDITHFKPPLTRPADFKEFWKSKLAAMRAIPFDEKLTEVPEKSSEAAQHFKLELTLADGKRFTTDLTAPRKAGKYLAMLGPIGWGTVGNKAVDPTRVLVGFPFPDEARYLRWKSRDDNNYLDMLLGMMRMTDYLRSRADVERIYLVGGSRTAPIQIINAALDSTKICGVDAYVPTSAGMSWTDLPYAGWGGKPSELTYDAWTKITAYFDPVNFAPDLTVPFVTGWGIGDDLARPEGIEALFQHTASSWKRICRHGGGHTDSKDSEALRKELRENLKINVDLNVNDKIMKEH